MGKPSYTVSWGDLQRATAEYEVELRVVVRFEVRMTRAGRAEPYAECALLVRDGWEAGRELVRVRDGLPRSDTASPFGALLYLLHQAAQALESDPWLWPADRRREARGEE